MLPFLTPQVFDALIWGVIVIGLVLAGLRLYRDLALPRRRVRPIPGGEARAESRPAAQDAAQPNAADKPKTM